MRAWVVGAALVFALIRVTPAKAAGADAVQRAAEHFDEGTRAFQAKRYEQAASHFEAAFAAVPNARALRVAMRAREAAGQPDRAATLAALAHTLYASDAETLKMASELLAKHGETLANVNIRCTSPCVVAVDGRVVPGGVDAQHSVYVVPGRVRLSASFASGGEEERTIDARRGTAHEVELSPVEEDAAPPPPAAPATASARTPTEPERVTPAARVDAKQPSAPRPLVPEGPPRGEPEPPRPSRPRQDAAWYESRGLFATSVIATAGVAGVAIWSGIDTLRDPGKDGVRAACAGLGTSCPEYQRGLEKQLRTNILFGATAGSALLTLLIGTFATNFHPNEADAVAIDVGPGEFGASFARTF